MSKTYFITGGGTGGHIYPAIAVADELIKNPDNILVQASKKSKIVFEKFP